MSTHTQPLEPLWRHYMDFYRHPIVADLGHDPRWTVSDADKRPIDMRALIDENILQGAKFHDHNCLVTLEELVNTIPNARNHAYYLSWRLDEIMIIDIEKTCPPEIAAPLLGLEYQYGELSMSGLGYHLVMPLPANIDEFPDARKKKVLKHPDGYYEILLEHYITFTREPISAQQQSSASDLRAGQDQPTWEDVYAELAKNAVYVEVQDIDIDMDKPELPHEETIVELMMRFPYRKNLDDFDEDNSRYEFSMMAFLYNSLEPILEAAMIRRAHEWTPSDKAWLIYQVARQWLAHRPKHDEYRNGMPLLLNAAMALTAHRATEELEDDQG